MRRSFKNVLTGGVFALAVAAAAGCSMTGVGIGSTDASQIDSRATLSAAEQAEIVESETTRQAGDL